MHQPFQFIERQVNDYAAGIGTVGHSWKTADEQAMLCWNVQDALSLGLTVLENIRRRHRLWMEKVDAGTFTFNPEDARGLASQFQQWLKAGRAVIGLLEECEKGGYVVERAGEFREACREVALMSTDIDRVQASVASLDEGRGIPETQALDELRNRLRSARS